MISFANWRWEISGSLDWGWNPLRSLAWTTWVRRALRTSPIKENGKGDSGSSCLRPLEEPRKPLGVPLSKIEYHEFVSQTSIQLIHFSPKPFWEGTQSRNPESTFVKSLFDVNFTNKVLWPHLLPRVHTFIGHKNSINNLPALCKSSLGGWGDVKHNHL